MACLFHLSEDWFYILTKACHSIFFPHLIIAMHEDNFSLRQGHKEMNSIPLEFLFPYRLWSFLSKVPSDGCI